VNEFTNFGRPSRLVVGSIIFLWAVFGYFTINQILRKDNAVADQGLFQELQKIALNPEKRSSHDWPQWRGPSRDGISSETGLLAVWPTGGPTKLWEQSTGGGFSSTIVVAGRVYCLFQDGDREAIVCWNADTGRENWRYRYPASFKNNFGNGPRSTPTVDGNRLYAVGATGIMTCLQIDGAQPELVWTKPLLEEFDAANLQWGTSFSPLVDGNLVYINPGGPGGKSLVALDKATGAVHWQSLDDAAGYSSPILTEIAGLRQIVFFTETGLVAVTPDQGKLLWRYPWKTDFGANIATPIVAGDYVYISSGYGKGCALVKVEKTDNGLAANLVYKNKKMKTHFSTCVLYQDHLYGFDDTILTCLNFRTGEVAWKERGFDKGSVTLADGDLVILGEYGQLALAQATPAGYHEKSRFVFSTSRCWTVPVIAEGRLYVRNEEKIACYDLRK